MVNEIKYVQKWICALVYFFRFKNFYLLFSPSESQVKKEAKPGNNIFILSYRANVAVILVLKKAYYPPMGSYTESPRSSLFSLLHCPIWFHSTGLGENGDIP